MVEEEPLAREALKQVANLSTIINERFSEIWQKLDDIEKENKVLLLNRVDKRDANLRALNAGLMVALVSALLGTWFYIAQVM